jgi:hypothetical protein
MRGDCMKKLLSILVIYSLGVLFVFTLANRVENIDNNKQVAKNYTITTTSYNE